MKKEQKYKYCIVKRKGHMEEFDERKIYDSCYAACLNAHIEHAKAEKITKKVCKEVGTWAKKKKIVDTSEIFKEVIVAMKKHDKDAAFMFETHRDIS